MNSSASCTSRSFIPFIRAASSSIPHATHLAHHFHLTMKSLIEGGADDFFSYLSCLFLFHRLLRVQQVLRYHPYQVSDWSYVQDKSLQRIHLLAISNEFDGFTTHFPDRQSAPPRVSPSSLVSIAPVIPTASSNAAVKAAAS